MLLKRPLQTITLPATERPILTVVVDTEEEFDWGAPLDRRATSVRHMRDIGRFQEIFDEFSAPPTYVVDHSIASQEESVAPLKAFAEQGRAVIGAHLHTWVSPPFDEEMLPRNSFQGNLPEELERAKLRGLKQQIAASFGSEPVIFKAGRYGIGPKSYEILEREGFQVDLSPAPPRDFSTEDGPDFSRWSADAFWFGESRALLCLPCTGAFVGWLGALSPSVYELGAKLQRLRAPGILARIGAVDRLALSPEGYGLEDMKKLATFLVARGGRVLSMSLHSPSCAPGFTPYVRSESDRREFLDRMRRFLQFFVTELNGECMSVPKAFERIVRLAPPAQALTAQTAR